MWILPLFAVLQLAVAQYAQGATNGDCDIGGNKKSRNCSEDYDHLPVIARNNPDYCYVWVKANMSSCDRWCYRRGMECIDGYSTSQYVHQTNDCTPNETYIGGCGVKAVEQGDVGRFSKFRLCLCGPYIDDDEINCVYSPRRVGKQCSSSGDPHIKGFDFQVREDKYDYMGIGTYDLYKNADGWLQVQVRIVQHPWRTKVSTNMAFAMSGGLLCGRVYEIHVASYDKTQFMDCTVGVNDANCPWDEWPHVFVVDGAEVTSEKFMNELDKCDMVCDKTMSDNEIQLTLGEGTLVRYTFFKTLKFGASVNVYIPSILYDPNNDSGQCFLESTPVDACDENNLFTYFKDGESCEDFQDDPDRPTDIGDPCEEADAALVAEGLALCQESCPEEVIPTCLFDVCIAEHINGAQEVADQCDFDTENPVEEEEYDGATDEPTPAPTPTPTPAPTLSPTPAPTGDIKCPIPMEWMEGIPFGNKRRLQDDDATVITSEVEDQRELRNLIRRFTRKRSCPTLADYVPNVYRSTSKVCAVYVDIKFGSCTDYCENLGYVCHNAVASQHTKDGKDPCIADPEGAPEGCDIVEVEESDYTNWMSTYRICVCGHGPIDCDYKLNKYNYGYKCNTFGDPHVQSFENYRPLDENDNPVDTHVYDQGEYILYKSDTYVEVQVRAKTHPWYQWNPDKLDKHGNSKTASGNFAVAFFGDGDFGFTCGDTYALHAGSPSKQPFIDNGKCGDDNPCDWGEYDPAFILNGVEVPEEDWIAGLDACSNVCSVEKDTVPNKKGVMGIEIRFLEGTKLRINKYQGAREKLVSEERKPQWGMDVRIWVENQLFDEVNDSGMCFSSFDDTKLSTCDPNSLFTYYRAGESCNDF